MTHSSLARLTSVAPLARTHPRWRGRLALPAVALGVAIGVVASPAAALQRQTGTAAARPAASPRVPLDTAVHMGRLPNGLHYYIRHSANPRGRALFGLIVNAGSILEDDDQRGLAHFVEHAAFNGSAHFPNHLLWYSLPSMGLQIGDDANASTSYETTDYEFYVPADPGMTDTAFLILNDIAHEVTFTPEEIAHERGIVFEERRLHQDDPPELHAPVLYGARYAARNPIGLGETILHAPGAAIERFYRDWYRPDLETVIIVGDVDPRAMEAKVIATFGAIPIPRSPRPRPYTRRLVVYDTAVSSVAAWGKGHQGTATIAFRRPAPDTVETEATVRRAVTDALAKRILQGRFDVLGRMAGVPFRSANLDEDDLMYGLEIHTQESITLEAAITRVVAEVARFAREGPTPAELVRAQRWLVARTIADTMTALNPSLTALRSDVWPQARSYRPIVDARAKGRFILQVVPTITAAQLQAVARQLLATRGPVVIVDVPKDDPYGLPAKDLVLVAFKDGLTRTFSDINLPRDTTPTLLATRPAPGRIVQEVVVPALGVTAWTLNNGARVLLKPTRVERGKIYMSAKSLGGLSVASDRDYPSAAVASDLVTQSGLGRYDAKTLDRYLVGTQASWSTTIDRDQVTAELEGAPDHAEVMFQLLDLAFTAPRLDTAKVAQWRQDARQEKFEGVNIATLRATTQHNPRVRPVIGAIVDSVDTTTVLRFYRESFGDAGRFTFVIVGDFTVDSLRPLVEEYVGGLPGRPSAAPYRGRDLGIRPPVGIVQQTVATGDSTSTTVLLFEAAIPVTPHTRVVGKALSTILEQRILTRLRQQLSGAYSPSGTCRLSPVPYPHGSCTIQFTSAPERAAELRRTAITLIDSLSTQGVTPTEVQAARVILRRTHEVNLQRNEYWMGLLTGTVTTGESLDDLAAASQQMQAVTAEEIDTLARTLLNRKRYVQVTSLPVRLLPPRPDEMRSALQW